MFWAAAAGGYKQQLFDDASTQVGRWQDLGAGCWTIIISLIITNIITIITTNIIIVTITIITIAIKMICTNPILGSGYDLFAGCLNNISIVLSPHCCYMNENKKGIDFRGYMKVYFIQVVPKNVQTEENDN